MNVGYFWKMQEILLNKINAIIRDVCRNLPTNVKDLTDVTWRAVTHLTDRYTVTFTVTLTLRMSKTK